MGNEKMFEKVDWKGRDLLFQRLTFRSEPVRSYQAALACWRGSDLGRESYDWEEERD